MLTLLNFYEHVHRFIPLMYLPQTPELHLIVWVDPHIILWIHREGSAYDHYELLQSKKNLPYLWTAQIISKKFTLQHYPETFVAVIICQFRCQQRKSLSFLLERIKANAWLGMRKVTCKSHPTVCVVLSLLLFGLQAHVWMK